MKTRISLLCCAFLLVLVPAAWATPPASAPLSGDCATKFEMASLQAPQPLTQQDIEKLSPLADAQAQSTDCCTQQDWDQCLAGMPEGCYIASFYCYQGWYCYCGYFCY